MRSAGLNTARVRSLSYFTLLLCSGELCVAGREDCVPSNAYAVEHVVVQEIL